MGSSHPCFPHPAHHPNLRHQLSQHDSVVDVPTLPLGHSSLPLINHAQRAFKSCPHVTALTLNPLSTSQVTWLPLANSGSKVALGPGVAAHHY